MKKITTKLATLGMVGALAFSYVPANVFAADSTTQDEKDDRPDDNDTPPDQAAVDSVSYTAADYKKWQKAYPKLDLDSFKDPASPTTIAPHSPTEADIKAFKEWLEEGGNPKNQVMKTVTAAVGETIANQMWDYLYANFWQPFMNKANIGSAVSEASGLKNVGAMQQGQFAAYFASFFPTLFQGKDGSTFEFQSIMTLINDGFLVSSDGTTYRLHNAQDGSIAYEIPVDEVATSDAQAFTVLVAKDGKTYYQAGLDKVSEIEDKFSVKTSDDLIAVHMIPKPTSTEEQKYPYLFPASDWALTFTGEQPSWWTSDLEAKVKTAFESWKKVAYNFDLAGFLDYFNTLPSEAQEPTAEDKALLKEWAIYKNKEGSDTKYAAQGSVWAGESIWNDAAQYLNDEFGVVYGQCPGPTAVKGITALGITLDKATEDKVGSSVGEKEFLGIWFTNTEKWEATGDSTYPYEAMAKLWKKGFIPSFDGTTWRLSSGKDGKIVYSATEKELLGKSATDAKSTNILPFAIGGAAAVVALAALGFVILKKKK
ncbi:MAG: hypothetical protein LBN08_01675 [Lactobacillales bacterium]|jgi:hypothetical protein|nr:hypothetical protein [Lactobacillales bacterium]